MTTEVSALTNERTSLQTESEEFKAEIALLKQMLSEANSNSQSSNSADLLALQEQFAKSQREVTRLRLHLVEAEDVHTQEVLQSQVTIDEYRAQIDHLESEKNQFNDVSSDRNTEISRLEEKCVEVQEMLDARFQENERISAEARQNEVSLANLQQVLFDFQSNQESEIEFALSGMKSQVVELETGIDEWKEKATASESRVTKMEKSIPDVEKLKIELAESSADNRKLLLDGMHFSCVY